MTEQQAMRMALEALEIAADGGGVNFYEYAKELRQYLEQQPADEPVARLKVADEPCNQVMALGQMMREWLQAQVSDAGTSVDVGKGFSEFDLWVQCEGKELFITIKEKND